MVCPSEFDIALYADAELSPETTQEVSRHLDGCAHCSDLLAGLIAENRLLVHSFQEVVQEEELEPVWSDVPAQPSVFWLAALVSGLAVGLQVALGILSGLELPAPLAWLDPSELSGQLNLVAGLTVYAAAEGVPMITSLVNGAAFSVAGALAFFAMFRLSRRYRGASLVLGTLALVMVFATPGSALDIRTGEQTVTIAANETVDDTLVVAAETINIDGTVTGDLIAVGQEVNVRGTVLGNVISGAQRIEVTGVVQGSVFGFAQNVRADGEIGQNIYGFGQSVDVTGNGRVEGNALIFGATGSVDGVVSNDAMMFGERLDISGEVGNNVRFTGSRFSLESPGRVGGNLTAFVGSEERVQVDAGASVGGQTDINITEADVSDFLTVPFYVGQAIRIAAALAMGLLLFWLLPVLRTVTLDTPRQLVTAGGVGFLVLVATPVAAVVAMITVIGIPVAIVGIMVWVLCLYLSKIVIALFIGNAILKPEDDTIPSTALTLLCGLVLIFIAVNIPLMGNVINVLLVLIGLGALMVTLYQSSDWTTRSQAQVNPAG